MNEVNVVAAKSVFDKWYAAAVVEKEARRELATLLAINLDDVPINQVPSDEPPTEEYQPPKRSRKAKADQASDLEPLAHPEDGQTQKVRTRAGNGDVENQKEQVLSACRNLHNTHTVITRARVAEQTELDPVAVGQRLKNLVDEGKLTRAGERRNTTYGLVEAQEA